MHQSLFTVLISPFPVLSKASLSVGFQEKALPRWCSYKNSTLNSVIICMDGKPWQLSDFVDPLHSFIYSYADLCDISAIAYWLCINRDSLIICRLSWGRRYDKIHETQIDWSITPKRHSIISFHIVAIFKSLTNCPVIYRFMMLS